MPLSCSCELDLEPGQKYAYPPKDYSTLETNKRKRCASCSELIEIGATVGRFDARRAVGYNEIEIAILGEDGEVNIADIYLCETCFDLYSNLEELQFCISPWEDMKELTKDYADTYMPSAKTT